MRTLPPLPSHSLRWLPFATLRLSALALCAAGCAPSLTVRTGSLDHQPLSVSARAATRADGVRLTLTFENAAMEPVSVDLDQLTLRGAGVAPVRALGRPQGFRTSGGAAATRRVPNGAVTVEPRGKTEATVEFPPLGATGVVTLSVPGVYRLGIDGQVPLAGVQLPLAPDAAASAAAEQQAFYDPFEE